MPFLFVSDGAPEAEDYDSNYIWYEAQDAESLRRAVESAKRRSGMTQLTQAPWLEIRGRASHRSPDWWTRLRARWCSRSA